MVLWVFMQAVSAFFLSSSDALAKKLLQNRDAAFIGFSRIAIAAVIVGITAIVFATPSFDKLVWLAIMAGGFLEAVAMIIYLNAIKISDFSKTTPFMALTPIGVAMVSFFINHEFPTSLGWLGITLVIMGSYVVNLEKLGEGLYAPIKEVIVNKGTALILLNVIIMSFAISISRFGVKRANPIFYAAGLLVFITLFLFLFLANRTSTLPQQFGQNTKGLLLMGALQAASSILSLTVQSLIQAAYANTVKRLNVLFSVLYGHFVFKEKNIAQHLIAVAMMLAGIAILAIYG